MTIREIQPEDADRAAQLSEELGYPVASGDMAERIRALHDDNAHSVLVACNGAGIVGWIDVGIVHHLQVDPYAEIGGLVVADGSRSQGIGAELVKQAENWARARGLVRIVVRSRLEREGAHRFYLRAGYELTKTSAVFSKKL